MAEIYRVAPKKPRPPGPVVGFFGGDSEASKAEAVAWIRENKWTRDDVSLALFEGDYLVCAKRRLW